AVFVGVLEARVDDDRRRAAVQTLLEIFFTDARNGHGSRIVIARPAQCQLSGPRRDRTESRAFCVVPARQAAPVSPPPPPAPPSPRLPSLTSASRSARSAGRSRPVRTTSRNRGARRYSS